MEQITDQQIPNKQVGDTLSAEEVNLYKQKINEAADELKSKEVKTKTGTVITFGEAAIYNNGSPITGPITFSFTEAKPGTPILVVCNNNAVFPGTVIMDGALKEGVNYVYLQYISNTIQLGRVHGAVGDTPEDIFTLADLNPFIWFEARSVDANDSAQVRDTGSQKFLKVYDDKSTFSRDFSQSVEEKQPELINAGLDTAYLSFGTGTQRVLTRVATPELFKQSFEIFLYVDLDVITSSVQILFEEILDEVGNGYIAIYIVNSVLDVRFNHVADPLQESRANTGSVFTTGKTLISVEIDFEGQKIRIRKDNILLGYGNRNGDMPVIDPSSINMDQPLTLFNRDGGIVSFRGKQRAFAITPKLTDAQRLSVMEYFSY